MATRLKDTDVVIVGLGAAGGLAALPLAQAGLMVVGLEAGNWMSKHDFSQIPITKESRIVGSLRDTHAYARIVADPSVRTQPVSAIMQKAFPYVDIETPVELLAPMITPENPAVLVRDFSADKTYVLTGYDILQAI